MKKLLILLIASLVFSGCNIKTLFVKAPAGLEINTSPGATVFINDQDLGSTPYSDKNIKPGEYTIRLVPDPGETELQPWETTITLDAAVTMIINRTFASNETEATSYTLQLKPDVDKSKAFVSVISDPDTASIIIDSTPHGFTPLSKIELPAGGHNVDVSSPGFKSITISVNLIEGYNLVVNANLAREIILLEKSQATSSATLDDDLPEEEGNILAEELDRPYVVIEETGTGWLRVRDAPNSTTAEELGKVNIGEKLPFIESNVTGWYKITFEGEDGWISGRFATLFE